MGFWNSEKKVKYKLEYEEFKQWVSSKKDETSKKLIEIDSEMLSLFCPFVYTQCVGEKCVHFVKSKVEFNNGSDTFKISPKVHYKRSMCKLWKI